MAFLCVAALPATSWRWCFFVVSNLPAISIGLYQSSRRILSKEEGPEGEGALPSASDTPHLVSGVGSDDGSAGDDGRKDDHALEMVDMRQQAAHSAAPRSDRSAASGISYRDLPTWRRFASLCCKPVVIGTLLSQCGGSFTFTSFVTFIPWHVQTRFPAYASWSSLVAAATVPAATCALLLTGWACKRWNWGTDHLLRVCVASYVFALIIIPLAFGSGDDESVSFPLFFSLIVELFAVSTSSMVPSIGVFSQELDEWEAADANALQNGAIRVLGTIPGPLLLGALLDRKDLMNNKTAFLIVGCVGQSAALISGGIAWWVVLRRARWPHPQGHALSPGDITAGAESSDQWPSKGVSPGAEAAASVVSADDSQHLVLK